MPTYMTCLCVQYKLCKVKKLQVGPKGVPFLITHDARTIRYPDPLIKVNDTIQVDIASGKIKQFVKFDVGECMRVSVAFRLSCQLICISLRWISFIYHFEIFVIDVTGMC